ncbi:MAG: cca [Gammaproteobacteria bacterium]|jgi:tRNA nucleotidyltransferase (CCA-adding enzyme)|nr:cca [Gammaproteobacteria bacterium]
MELEVYQVGGSVRDTLLGLPVVDKDYVVVGATPQDMLARGFRPVGKDFPVFLHPRTKEEYALARKERKVALGYHGFTFDTSKEVSLEEDLARRDLTINAMALTSDGTLIDPYGGLADLENRVLRHVSPAFVEDPIRVLRLARFAARFRKLGFTIAPETLALAEALRRAGELDALVPERVWQETWKALSENDPVEYFKVLRKCGALPVLFPELEALFGIPTLVQDKHFMDSGTHALLALSNAASLSPLPEVRFAALTHALGKALKLPIAWPEHTGYEEHTEEPLNALAERYKIPRHVKELALVVAHYHPQWNTAVTPETILDFLDTCDALRRPERFENILLACEACFITHQYPDHSEFLLKTLSDLREKLKETKPALANAGKALKNIYRQMKLDCLKKILLPTN